MSCLSRFRLITFDVTDTLIKFRTAPGKQYGEIGALFGVNQDDHHDLVANFRANWWVSEANGDLGMCFNVSLSSCLLHMRCYFIAILFSGGKWTERIQISDSRRKSAKENGGENW